MAFMLSAHCRRHCRRCHLCERESDAFAGAKLETAGDAGDARGNNIAIEHQTHHKKL